MNLFFNPFTKIAGLPALSFGLLFLIIGSMLAGFFNARFDGALDLHFGYNGHFIIPLIDQLTIWITMVVVFFAIALILGTKPRLLDLAGTFALARIPYMLAPLINAGGFFTTLTDNIRDISPQNLQLSLSVFEVIILISLTLITVFLAVWLVTLYFNAYKVCTNLKGKRLVISFIAGLLASEIVSVYLIRIACS